MKTFRQIYSETDKRATLTLGYEEKTGRLHIITSYTDNSGEGGPKQRSTATFTFDAEEALLKIGEAHIGKGGRIELGLKTIILDGDDRSISVGSNPGGDGTLQVKNRFGRDAITLEGARAAITIGDEGTDGSLILKNRDEVPTIFLNGRHGNLELGGVGADGDLTLKNFAGETAVFLNGSEGEIVAGGVGTNGQITIKNNTDIETIKITGSDGDIQFLNADFAEEFEIQDDVYRESVPGTVMILNDQGNLQPSYQAYDPKVVGVIAGAGGYQPALVLDKRAGDHRRPVAMIGKIYCQVSASEEPVRVGDLLTTSNKKGYAMKASDRSQALGTIIGKSLGNLPHGDGLLPVLINLQ